MSIISAYMVPHPPLILPEVGRGGEKQIHLTSDSYARAAGEIAAQEPETIIITSPHAIMYRDYFHISPGPGAKGSFARFNAPDARFEMRYDEELVREICRLAQAEGFPAGTQGERDPALDHGTMVPLYFIRRAYAGRPLPKIIRIGLSALPPEDHYRLGQMIRTAVENTGRRAVFVASGDLSHKLQEHGPYGFAPEGPLYDSRIMDVCGRAAFGELFDFEESFLERAAECGHPSFVIMAGALDGLRVDAEVYSHEDVTGVGYGICAFHPGEPDDKRRFLDIRREEGKKHSAALREKCDPWVRLAWQSVESWVVNGEIMAVPRGLPQQLIHTRAGAFVSIHKEGKLRGCIGTILPTRESLAEEIIHNAVSAASRDPRFSPIKPDELPYLEIQVDVLGDPEDISSEKQLDVRRYGVIVTSGSRRGLLLPDLEGVDTAQQQIDIARRKAGIRPDEKIRLQRFEVVRHT